MKSKNSRKQLFLLLIVDVLAIMLLVYLQKQIFPSLKVLILDSKSDHSLNRIGFRSDSYSRSLNTLNPISYGFDNSLVTTISLNYTFKLKSRNLTILSILLLIPPTRSLNISLKSSKPTLETMIPKTPNISSTRSSY